ncbi:hypothetical protein OH809_37250 [Streptomyces sp. NBC_00873]|nr:hypothetical protein OH809_37250 [Streptomyces sp. NBC_00873]WTA42298.1 hypothetical protein OH821_06460 [Streptomyces sp. NBC_00842]
MMRADRTVTWPNTTPCTPDNIIAKGQSFAFTGSGSKLAGVQAQDPVL